MPINVWVATDLGSIRGVDFTTQQNTVVTYDELSPAHEITTLCLSTSSPTSLYCTLREGLVNVFDLSEGIYVNQFEIEGDLVTSFDVGESLVTCTKSGRVIFWRDDELEGEFSAGSNLECCVPVGAGQLLTGGREQELRLWDCEKRVSVWQARNVRRDELDIRVPVWVRSVGKVDENVFCVGTQYHQVRLYDRRTKRRPVGDVSWGELPIISMATKESHCYFGNGKGDLGRLDTRMTGGPVVKFKGAAGSLRGIALHPSEPFIASVGLDRHLRVHNTLTRELVHKFYLKHKLNSVVFMGERVGKEEDEEEEEDVWDGLEQVKRRKVEEEEE